MKKNREFSTILLDGQWNLKRNYYPPHRKTLKGANGKLCGGTFGFLDSTRYILNKLMPDRVVVAWDGFHAGKMRYNIYKPYKANREKDWENETRIISTEGMENSDDSEKFQLLSQKIDIQMYLDELSIRQLEADYIEADDFIAYYILGSIDPDEHIYIFSRDKDFHQLVSDKVSIITPDSLEVITIHNFRGKFGYIVDNALLFKCFEGDSSDDIEGVTGITTNTLLKYFPASADEKYTYKRFVEEAYEIQKSRKKPLATLNKIIDAEHVLYRNAKLMNLRKPLLNQESIDLVDSVRSHALDSTRSVEAAMEMFAKDGMVQHVWDRNLQNFFGAFYNLRAKEKEFEESLK